jgi:hypothetical protein
VRAAAAPGFVPRPMQPPPPNQPRAGSTVRTAGNALEQFVDGLQRAVRTAVQRQRRPQLPDFDPAGFGVPRDFRVYVDQVKELAKARVWSSGQASKVERLGRPAFVAAVQRLHDFDYDDADDCRHAANLHKLLQQMTGVSGLASEASGLEGCETDACRFGAIADAWRRLAEKYGKHDAGWQQLLAGTGKLVGSER